MIFFFFPPPFSFTRHCAKPPSTSWQRARAAGTFSCVTWRHQGRWRQTYHMVLLLLYCPLSCTYRKGGKNPKCVRFVCTLCYIGTELHRKGWTTEKHAISNPFDFKIMVWRVKDDGEYRVQDKGLFRYLLHQNVDPSGVCVGSSARQVGCTWRCVDLPLSPSASLFLSSFGDLSLFARVSMMDPREGEREKKKSSQSCWLLSFLISSSGLKLLVDKAVSLCTLHLPLNTQQSSPLKFTTPFIMSDGKNLSFQWQLVLAIVIF